MDLGYESDFGKDAIPGGRVSECDAKGYYPALADLAQLIARPRPLDRLLQAACEQIVARISAKAAYIVLVDTGSSEARIVASAGFAKSFVESQPVSLEASKPGGMGIAARTFRLGKTLVLNELPADYALAEHKKTIEQLGLASAVGIPLRSDGLCRAVLGIMSDRPQHFTSAIVGVAERMGDMLSVAIERHDEREASSRYSAFYAALADVNDLVTRDADFDILFEQTCRVVADISPHLAAAIVFKNDSDSHYQHIAWSQNLVGQTGFAALRELEFSANEDEPAGRNLIGEVLRGKKIVRLDEEAIIASGRPALEVLYKSGTRSLIGIPIVVGRDVEGVLVLSATSAGYFTEEIQHLAKRLADTLGRAVLSRRNRQILERRALTDGLTGIPNRQLFMDRLKMAISRAERDNGRVAVAVVDLDDLKEINDQFGHSKADQLICSVAAALSNSIRSTDTLARLGGDEFAAVIRIDDRIDTLEAIAGRMLTAASRSVRLDRDTIHVTASVGFAFYPDDGKSARDLLRRADLAMYAGKRLGGNCWHLFEEQTESALIARHRIRTRFEKALSQGEIKLYYQPKVNMRTGEVFGAEALARWKDPEKGLLMPASWMPAIEGNAALSTALGRHVLAEVVDQLRRWHSNGLHILISLNVGVRHLQMPWFVADIENALSKAPQLAPYLGLEVTETALVEDFERLRKTLMRCREMGVRIALDDFGTGYASLAYLEKLPADVIKIDIAFVLKMLSDMRSFSIVAGTLQICQMLGLRVVAEGVESEEHGKWLLQLGCDFAQGFAMAGALPGGEFERWVKQWRAPAAWVREQAALVVPYRHRLLGAIVYHRTRQQLIFESNGSCDKAEDMRRVRCPMYTNAEIVNGTIPRGLKDLHDQLHRVEEKELYNVLHVGGPSEEGKSQLEKGLTKFEWLVMDISEESTAHELSTSMDKAVSSDIVAEPLLVSKKFAP